MKTATIKDKVLVTEILVSAFMPLKENNSINFVIKQDDKRAERIRLLMEYLFEKAIRSGKIYLSDNQKACILLHFPQENKINLKWIIQNLRLAFKCIGITRVFKVLKRQRMMKQYHPKEKHIIPLIMGVREEFQGSGIGGRLILEVKNKFKHNELPVILNAASEHNALLYKKFGFKLIKKDDSLGFPIYMLRMN